MIGKIRVGLVGVILFGLTLISCSLFQDDPDEVALSSEQTAGDLVQLTIVPSATPTETPSPTFTATPTFTPEPSATYTPTPTATPVIIPGAVEIRQLSGIGDRDGDMVNIEHPVFGSLIVIDKLAVPTNLQISWTDDDPQSAVLRFRDEENLLVERKAGTDPKPGELKISPVANIEGDQASRHAFQVNSGDIFPAQLEIERLVTLELTDELGNKETAQIMLSKHDYESGFTGPMALTLPQYDQLEIAIDWQSEHYAPLGIFADWLNDHPEMWDRVTIDIAGRDRLTWRDIKDDDLLLHKELEQAEYESEIIFTYFTADGEEQIFSRDQVPYYTKFAIIHAPSDESEIYILRAGRDPGVTEELLQEMAAVVRHMFTNRPQYLDELAQFGAVHSVAPGTDLGILPEIAHISDEINKVVIDDVVFGQATGIAILERHPEISASAAYYFDNETPVTGLVLMHEVVHQVQYLVYGFDWARTVEGYYENYMELPARERIPNIEYYETSPWEWDALLTPIWFSWGSDLHDNLDSYLDLEVGQAGTTIRSHLQQRWGDPLPQYDPNP